MHITLIPTYQTPFTSYFSETQPRLTDTVFNFVRGF